MGLITDIQPPDPELRTAIFKIKTKEAGIELSNEVLTFLAENIRSNIRQIEGAIKSSGLSRSSPAKRLRWIWQKRF